MGKAIQKLKNSLKERGVIKPNTKKKTIQKGSSKLKAAESTVNPYELKFTREKHSIINRKVKGVSGNPSLSRKKSFQKRAEQLLPELLSKTRESQFEDKRIGEFDPNMSVEDKMFQRFLKEQKRKSSVFNLEDHDLTHMGRSLSEINDFAHVSSEEEEGDDKFIGFETVKDTHFGGFSDEEGGEDRQKSKAEVMKEVIAKSKMHKYERQKQKEDDIDLIDELDADMDDIRDLLFAPKETPAPEASMVGERRAEGADYDVVVRELAMEKRAKPTDRLKTEEELAEEARAKLEQLERERLARMDPSLSEKKRIPQGDDLSDHEYEKKPKSKAITYDDNGVLVMDNDDEEEEATGSESDEEQSSEEEEEDSDESEEEEDSEEEESGSEVGSDLENTFQDVEEEQLEEEKEAEQPIKKATIPDSNELPYVIEAPETHEQFLNLVADRSDKDLDTAIERIRVLYHTKLHPHNKKLLAILLDHMDFCTSDIECYSKEKLNVLQRHIYELSVQFPALITQLSVDRLSQSYKTFSKRIKMPEISDLMFLRHIGATFSTSDFKHAIVIPAQLFMGQALNQCAINSTQAAASGLFLIDTMLMYNSESKRYSPECVSFLYRLLEGLLGPISGAVEFPKHPLDIVFALNKESSLNPLSFVDLFSGHVKESSLLFTAVSLLFRVINQQADQPSFLDIFQYVNEFIDRLPAGIKAHFATDIEKFKQLSKRSTSIKRPLQLQKRKPIPIATFNPKFQERFSVDKRNNDPDRERAEEQKLRRQYKQEFKGAVKELKKDADFIAREKLKQVKQKDAQYKKMVNSIMGQLASQEGAMRGYEREKKKPRKL